MKNKPITAEQIQALVKNPIDIKVFKKIDSTNTYAKKNYQNLSSSVPTIIIAEEQTNGYGRFKREFYSPQTSGIYLTIVLPIGNTFNPGLLTLGTGVAVVRALKKQFHKSFTLKWVNDILLNNQKCGGILAESISDSKGQVSHIILGIGLNINTNHFPLNLKNIATSASNIDEIDRNVTIGNIINEFLLTYINYQTGIFLSEYRTLCSTLGKKAEVINGNNKLIGIAQDVTKDGSLVLIDDKKNRHIINSGEVKKVYSD